MLIAIPMLLLVFAAILRNMLRVSGACMLVAALAVLWVREGWRSGDDLKTEPVGG